MPGLLENPAAPAAAAGFSVSAQKVHLDIDFATLSVKGKTEITVQPHSKELRTIRLNCRQLCPHAVERRRQERILNIFRSIRSHAAAS